jgi:hypothetical protein
MKFSTGILTLLSLPLFAGEDQSTSPEGERFQLFAGEQELDLEYEGLLSNEIEVQRAAMRYSQRRGLWRTDIGASMTDYSIDYQPFAPLGGLPEGLSETTRQFNLSASYALSGSVESSLAFSHYDGFADFRSIWIAEYYRQAFNFPGSGYQAPDPHGFSIVSGWVWDPKPGTRFSLDLTYGEDTIAPGWSFRDPGNDLLKNRAFSLSWEQAINPSLKTETSFTYFDITDREARMIFSSSWNWAMSDDLTLGANFGGSREEPDFEAVYGGISLTYQLNPRLSIRAEARLYDDSGEIETSGFNASAPGLRSSEVGLSALYEIGAHSFRIGVARYLADYGSPDPENEFFTNLYDDRDWWTIRTAYSFRF